MRNSLEASVKAKVEKIKSLEIDWSQLLQVNESKTQKPCNYHKYITAFHECKSSKSSNLGARLSHGAGKREHLKQGILTRTFEIKVAPLAQAAYFTLWHRCFPLGFHQSPRSTLVSTCLSHSGVGALFRDFTLCAFCRMVLFELLWPYCMFLLCL